MRWLKLLRRFLAPGSDDRLSKLSLGSLLLVLRVALARPGIGCVPGARAFGGPLSGMSGI